MLAQISSNLGAENAGSSSEFKRECARFNLSLSCADLSVVAVVGTCCFSGEAEVSSYQDCSSGFQLGSAFNDKK